MRRTPILGLFFPLITLSACSSTSADPGQASGAPSAADAGATRSCQALAPRLGDTDEARALAASPARCGQAPYTWLSDPTLGDVKATGVHETYVGSALGLLAAAGGITPTSPLSDVTVDQIEYVTQDRGKLLDATALVAYPTGGDPNKALEVLLVLHGTAGFEDGCAPSSALETRQLAATFAANGYVVVAPDYIGMRALGGPTGFLHPYLVGQPTAIASLDAVRAASKFVSKQDDGSCVSPRFVTIGGSQGGHAALWVDRLTPYYAPELDLAGVIATVPPADLEGETLRALRDLVPASANVAAFYAAASDWYGVSDRLSEVFVSPFDTSLPAAMKASCDPSGAITQVATLGDAYQKTLLDAAQTGTLPDPWGCIMRENGLLTTSIPRVTPAKAGFGMLFIFGEKDTLVSTSTERDAFTTLCGRGLPLAFLECAGASHTEATKWALPEVLDFARDRLAGKPMDAACAVADPVTCRATK